MNFIALLTWVISDDLGFACMAFFLQSAVSLLEDIRADMRRARNKLP